MTCPFVNPAFGYRTLSRFDRDRRRPSTSTSSRAERGIRTGVCPPARADRLPGMDPNALVLQYLDEAHATETALVTNLRAHKTMTTDSAYERLLERHLEETQAHVKNIDQRRAEL